MLKINGHEDYEISRSGEIISYKRKIPKTLKHQINKKGYHTVDLSYSKGIIVHRLVALAYLPNPNNYPHVNHIDGNKDNNDISNLEWCTNLHNMRHAFENGYFKDRDEENKRKTILSLKEKSIDYIDVEYINQRCYATIETECGHGQKRGRTDSILSGKINLLCIDCSKKIRSKKIWNKRRKNVTKS